MRLTLNSLGLLVRPRIISNAKVYPRLNVKIEQDKWNVDSMMDFSYLSYNKEINLYKLSYETLFDGLVIGDTRNNPETCYVGKIVSFIISLSYGNYIVVDDHNIDEIMNRISKMGRKLDSFPINMVGLKFYKGIERDSNNHLVPINQWDITKEHIWFYRSWDLVSIESVIEYEKLQPGNLVLFARSRGMVLKTKFINKVKFYNTNSWSSASITMLSSNGKKTFKFLPNRRFKKFKGS